MSPFDPGFWAILTLTRGLKPGQKTLDAIGGAHRLQSWPHNILTGMSYGNFSENEDRRLSRSLEQIVEGV